MNQFNYNDSPQAVIDAIREQHRSGAEIAERERPKIAKADAHRRQVLSDIGAKYWQSGIPANARFYYDSAAGSDNCLSLIDGALALAEPFGRGRKGLAWSLADRHQSRRSAQ